MSHFPLLRRQFVRPLDERHVLFRVVAHVLVGGAAQVVGVLFRLGHGGGLDLGERLGDHLRVSGS